MKLADYAKTPPTKSYRCSFKEWVDTLDDEDQNAVYEMLYNDRFPVSYITEVFQEHGCPVVDTRIRYHRKRLCKTCNHEA